MRVNIPKHSGIKQQTIYCVHGFCPSGIWAGRTRMPCLLYNVCDITWLAGNSQQRSAWLMAGAPGAGRMHFQQDFFAHSSGAWAGLAEGQLGWDCHLLTLTCGLSTWSGLLSAYRVTSEKECLQKDRCPERSPSRVTLSLLFSRWGAVTGGPRFQGREQTLAPMGGIPKNLEPCF